MFKKSPYFEQLDSASFEQCTHRHSRYICAQWVAWLIEPDFTN